MSLGPLSYKLLALCFLLIFSATSKAQFPCATWLTPSTSPSAQKFLAAHPELLQSLKNSGQGQFVFTPLELTYNFTRGELLPLAQYAPFDLNAVGHHEGDLWRGVYTAGPSWPSQTLLAYLAPELLAEIPQLPTHLAQAWQKFAAIYLHKIKLWHFPAAPYLPKFPRRKNIQRILTFYKHGIALEWRTKGYYPQPDFWAAFLRRPTDRKALTEDQLTRDIARALAAAWAQELSANQEFMAQWQAAAELDHASTNFTAHHLIPLLLDQSPQKYQHRRQVFAAAAMASWQENAWSQHNENTFYVDPQTLTPRANIYNVLEVDVSLQEDPLAAEEKNWAAQFPGEIVPERSIFYGRQDGLGKLYQVTRRYKDEIINFKILMEDFSVHPDQEQLALNQLRWIVATIPGKYWQKVDTLQILPPQENIYNLDHLTFMIKSNAHLLIGQARLRVTTSLHEAGKRDVILFLEEGLAVYLQNPGLGQHLARDLAEWMNTHPH